MINSQESITVRKYLEVFTMSNQMCQYLHMLSGVTHKLGERSSLCTYQVLEKGLQVCNEDVGSALIRNNTLTGILTWTNCNGSVPPVYIRISQFARWIQRALSQ